MIRHMLNLSHFMGKKREAVFLSPKQCHFIFFISIAKKDFFIVKCLLEIYFRFNFLISKVLIIINGIFLLEVE